uniref:Uncharacterized protein n=1 Tax=Pyramimonas obovata TaxID=1411642 RepID=A0A7S0QZL9_9CHLO
MMQAPLEMTKMMSNNTAGRRACPGAPSAVSLMAAPRVNSCNRRVRPPALMRHEGAMRSIAEEFHTDLVAKEEEVRAAKAAVRARTQAEAAQAEAAQRLAEREAELAAKAKAKEDRANEYLRMLEKGGDCSTWLRKYHMSRPMKKLDEESESWQRLWSACQDNSQATYRLRLEKDTIRRLKEQNLSLKGASNISFPNITFAKDIT